MGIFRIPLGEQYLENLTGSYSIINQIETSYVHRLPPITIGQVNKVFHKLISPPQKLFIIRASNWRVWGNQGAVINNNNYLFRDVSREYSNKSHSIFKQIKLIKPTKLDFGAAVVAASGSSIYYHWMFDILPRIGLLQQSNVFNEIERLIINFDQLNFQSETLAKCGLNLSSVIPSNNHWSFHLQINKLFVPSMISPNDEPSLEACLYLRNLFAQEIENKQSSIRLYLKRSNGRKILNEEEVLALLVPLNFQIVDPGMLCVSEQASLFATAESVISAHGSGLTNIVFCTKSTKVIDLFSPAWINPCYWFIANHLDLKYGYLIGEPLPNKMADYKQENVLVNIKHLKELLKLMRIE